MTTVPEDRGGHSAASPSLTASFAVDAQPVMPTLVFVHGACVRDADWWWSRMVEPLAKRGIGTVAVALPSCGETGDALGDLADDVQACREVIRAVDGPVVLCGHSYGGVVITEAGAEERVIQLLYVTSLMPDAGQSQAQMIGTEPAAPAGRTCLNVSSFCHWKTNAAALAFSPSESNFTVPCTDCRVTPLCR